MIALSSSSSLIYGGILLAVLVTLVTGFIAMRIARKVGLMDIPGIAPHKLHSAPTPLAGGIALALALPVLVLVFGTWRTPSIRSMLLAAIIIFIFGLLDDFKAMSPLPKLIGQVLAAVFLIYSGIYIRAFENPFFYIGGPQVAYIWLDYLLTILWVVGITNAFNLADSMDGEVAGLSVLAFAFFALGAYESLQFRISFQSALILGICIALYLFNAPPARLFLGDSAAQTLGFILAVIAILYNPLDRLPTASWFLPILLVGVPIFDTTLVFFSRLRRKKPFYIGARDHSYHRLVNLGLDSNHAVLTIHLAALVLDCLAFIAISLEPLGANLVFGFCVVVGIFLLFFLDRKSVCP